MAYLTLGDFMQLSGLGSAQEDYEACRTDYPAGRTPGVLTVQDPCWTKLVAYRRSEGRDPLGRDIGQVPPRMTKPRSVSAAEARMRELGTNMDPISRPTLPSSRPDRIGEVQSSEEAARVQAMAATMAAEREIEILKAKQQAARTQAYLVGALGAGLLLWIVAR